MLRPLPDLDNATAMAKLGRLTAIRSARLDAAHELRDVVAHIQAANADIREQIAIARAALDRIEELERLSEIVSA